MNDTVQISIISPPDRKWLTAEIMIGNEQWAELSQEGGKLACEFYSRRDGQAWRIGYDTALRALVEAKRRLLKYTDVYTMRDGRWQMVAWQSTRLSD